VQGGDDDRGHDGAEYEAEGDAERDDGDHEGGDEGCKGQADDREQRVHRDAVQPPQRRRPVRAGPVRGEPATWPGLRRGRGRGLAREAQVVQPLDALVNGRVQVRGQHERVVDVVVVRAPVGGRHRVDRGEAGAGQVPPGVPEVVQGAAEAVGRPGELDGRRVGEVAADTERQREEADDDEEEEEEVREEWATLNVR
jgi:hypothetical protein